MSEHRKVRALARRHVRESVLFALAILDAGEPQLWTTFRKMLQTLHVLGFTYAVEDEVLRLLDRAVWATCRRDRPAVVKFLKDAADVLDRGETR